MSHTDITKKQGVNPCAREGKAVPAPPCYSYIKSDKSVVGYKVVRYVEHIEIPVRVITPHD